MTVREMLVRIDADELLDWQAFEQEFGPLPDRRADYHAAQLVAAILNVNRGKNTKARTVEDELLRFKRPERSETEEGEGVEVRVVRPAKVLEPEWKKNKALFLAWAREDAVAQKAKKPRTSKIRKPRTTSPGA